MDPGQSMAGRPKRGLTDFEKSVVKALFAKGWRNQDIHAWINSGRQTTVNFGRISGVKNNPDQQPATEEEVAYFMLHRRAYDAQTGLNRYDDERLIRAREAMILAVQAFNSAGLRFKTEVFTILANVAWTYLLHEYYSRKTTVEIVNWQGQSISLSEMIARRDCPLREGVKKNLSALKILRDRVEHHLLGKADLKWLGMFQACCVNFDRTMCELFGNKLTLANELSIRASVCSDEPRAPHADQQVRATGAHRRGRCTRHRGYDAGADQRHRLPIPGHLHPQCGAKVEGTYTVREPGFAEGKEIHNVLSRKVVADELYPYKPGKVVKLVAAKTRKHFTSHNHLQAIRKFKVRPKNGSAQPKNTDKAYCVYHAAHKDYTYSDAWVEKLVQAVKDPQEFAAIKAMKLN